ncbi:hypothetical protein CRM22_005924 [Opisthorchis felineus]|uniref:MARVEL domain-containing protein n=1 Tax=Opisthorchis felineus TaxID=147828 RepID=A0A4S2LNN1_OPIFE|nr:hypothetical protein CRM22_005924 [Opisthorchis felineus]
MRGSVVLLIKLVVAIILLIIALCIPEWGCGRMFSYWCSSSNSFNAVGVFVCAGLVCLVVVLILDLIAMCVKGASGLSLVRAIFLIAGACCLIIGLIIYVIKAYVQWSYVLSICATTLASELALITIFGCCGIN